jgi:protein-S-isoprenylcysteine O-methyltransferase Ste14
MERFKRGGAAVAVVVVSCGLHGLAPHNGASMNRLLGNESFNFTGAQFLATAAAVYSLAVFAYHFVAGDAGPTKSLRFVRVLGRFLRAPAAMLREGLEPEDRVALLTTLLKAFFGPLMAMSLMFFCIGALGHGLDAVAATRAGASWRELLDEHGFRMAMQVILFVDVFFFTVGYLVESPRLGNQIRSVDPTLLGWVVALACYPPFNTATSAVLGFTASDFPRFDDPTIHMALNVALLVLMVIYASASAALGLKASNLTHRGIVSRGPYAVIRHPAYTCKNLAWWIGSMPLLSVSFGESFYSGITALASVVAWSMLYVLRALTEEDHLRRVDGEYAAYAQRVRYRFIPGIS